MPDVYYYLPVESLESAVCCGLKLSDRYDREVRLDGEMKKCISTLLNPRDDIEKYRSDNYRLLGLSVGEDRCFVADRFLYELSDNNQEIRELYYKTIIPVGRYRFGSFRQPECLVFTTIIAEEIHIADRGLDFPVIYENSEDLYLKNIIESLRENVKNIDDVLLYYFLNKLAESGKVVKIEDEGRNETVFLDLDGNAAACIKKPDETAEKIF